MPTAALHWQTQISPVTQTWRASGKSPVPAGVSFRRAVSSLPAAGPYRVIGKDAVEACDKLGGGHFDRMLNTELSRTALQLSPSDRLELARRLLESVVEPAPLNAEVKEGIRRIEDVASGRVAGITEEQYRAALG